MGADGLRLVRMGARVRVPDARERSRPGRLGRSTDIGSPPHGSPSARPLLRGTSLGGVWGWTLDGHRASGRGAGRVVQAEMWTGLGGPFIRDREPTIWAHPVAFSGSDLALTAPESMPSSRHPSDRSFRPARESGPVLLYGPGGFRRPGGVAETPEISGSNAGRGWRPRSPFASARSGCDQNPWGSRRPLDQTSQTLSDSRLAPTPIRRGVPIRGGRGSEPTRNGEHSELKMFRQRTAASAGGVPPASSVCTVGQR